MAIKIALAGNPNCGKTTMFNALTGANQYVGNWPGVTVEKKEGKCKENKDVIVTDLPGIYSLSPYTLEEVVSRDYLLKEKPEAIINLVDATNIERNLYLTTQLLELGIPVVIALNMADLLEKNKISIDTKALEKELLTDEKELAEHNMLVDLGRNDLGKISRFGTVKVEKLHSVERFSHVMHIGSSVSGKIKEEYDALDAIEAVLPAGTLSGAPKIRACQLIGELENNKRGIYGDAVGYIDFAGNMDTCIAIRMAYKKNGKVFVRSGAGIVADSVPEREYEECLNKAKATLKALELAEEVEE